MSQSLSKKIFLFGVVALIPIFGWVFWSWTVLPDTLTSAVESYRETGVQVKQDLEILPALAFAEEGEIYQVTDTATDGIDIRFADAGEKTLTEGEGMGQEEKKNLTLAFPKDYSKPIEVKLDGTRTIIITDLSGNGEYTASTLAGAAPEPEEFGSKASKSGERTDVFSEILKFGSSTSKKEPAQNYLRYQSKDQRKELFYAFQKDQATGEKKLKHWTLYKMGNGLEKEEYRFENAKLRLNEKGEAEVYYFGGKEIQNEQVKGEVENSLLERAQRTLAKEMGEDILAGGQSPDFIIPKAYYLDKTGEKHDAEWKWNDEIGTLSVTLALTPEQYPIVLDPTLSFTAPGQSNTGNVITGEVSSQFGASLTSGDFNADGKTDLAVGAYNYSSSIGRTYIFYNDSSIPTVATGADITITGETINNYFGASLTSGDFNADGKTDLAVGAYRHSSSTGRTYIFYNDGSIPTTAATADVTITGEASNNNFGFSLASGDFNADGKTDLAVGASNYSGSAGRTYIFYNGSIITENATGADVTITGEASSSFGCDLTAGDFNADSRTDLAVGAYRHSSFTGRTYIFYNGSIITENATGADVTITGEASSSFGYSLTAGDFNADGKTDLAVGATGYSTNTGRTYIFYNDGTIPTTAATADVTITGEASSSFGYSLTAGDFNADGKTDLAVGAYNYSSSIGRTYIFYSQNGQVNTNQNIVGETVGDSFGISLSSGDFNADGKTDLAVGAMGYSGSTGRTYIFYNDGSIPATAATADVIITGETINNNFGFSLAAGDFNADGRTDLVVGAVGYSTNTGRTYIFYNDGSIPTTAVTADVTITGVADTSFGDSLTSGDFNADGTTDFVVGAPGGNRVYIFYNDGAYPATAVSADVSILSSDAGVGYFGSGLEAGDFNADGKVDLAAADRTFNSNAGKIYIFYNDGTYPGNTTSADVSISAETTGAQRFGIDMAVADLNTDGRADLVVSSYNQDSSAGKVYTFYSDGAYPSTAASADIAITGETANNYFGKLLAIGDFNADGRTDLAVGATGYSTNTGRTYIFYNDGSIPTTAATADVIITGETTNNYFGYSLASGDWNADGKTDLAVGAYGHSASAGKIYLYETRENFAWKIQKQEGGTLRTGLNTTGQEMKITGETASNFFGISFASGDFNADGKTDLAVGAKGYSTSTGRAYIFYNDSSLSTAANNADITITGETGSYFGYSLTSGDFNADGKTDLAVGTYAYLSFTGRAYIFYNDGSISTTAGSADVIITGETSSSFGYSLASGDWNADGKTDLAVGASGYSSATGRAYIFYNGSIVTENASGADVTITGEAASLFGYSLASGDFNADGTADLTVGASGYSTNTGRTYIFYNGSIVTENASGADVTITGEASSNQFGYSLASGDFNADGKIDLVVGAANYVAATGRAYIFYNGAITTENASGADVTITGEATSNYFGNSLAAGDFNADGKTDLAATASVYSSSTGRAYIFYNGAITTENASGADVTITGETTSNSFGASLASGDFNADGKTDLAVGAFGYSSSTGRAYIYTFNDPVITGEAGSYFGISLASGDFNSDGKTDLAVGASSYSGGIGRTYIFYGGSIITENATGADVIITGEASSSFSYALVSGDFNADGRTDLAVGAIGYSGGIGRAYIFYNGAIITENATGADVTITGEAANSSFGWTLTSGDFNADGKIDLAVGASNYVTSTGRTYIFYADGTNDFGTTTCSGTPADCLAVNADAIITGESTNNSFGISLASGDFNADGKTDLAVGARRYSGDKGRAYIFYNGSIITENASGADIAITATTVSYFGTSLASGDFNADGKTDLAVGANVYSSERGSAYIFYNGSIITENATGADVTITGETSTNFGRALVSGDFNADGKTDLAVGAYSYSSFIGRAYIFYNDGSIPTTAASADNIITGVSASGSFGYSLASGDFNADGKTDLAVGAVDYATQTGRIYIFISEAAAASPAESAKIRGTVKIRGTAKIR